MMENVTLLYSDMSCGRYVTLFYKTESRSVCGSDDNSEFSFLKSEFWTGTQKLVELQIALGSEYLVQY